MTDTLPMPVTEPFTPAQRATLFNLVRRAANTEILPRFLNLNETDVSTKSGPTDLVTQADLAAEAMIARGLKTTFPNAVVVGEETSETDPYFRDKLAKAELGFLIDPIDGTWNFANGLGCFATMIAACRFGRPTFGLIFDPIARQISWADLDTRATRISATGLIRQLTTNSDTPLNNLRGYIELSFMSPNHSKIAANKSLELAQTSTLRCSAHQYRLLAEGAVDFNLAAKLSPWDHAAGSILCQMAGGHSAMLDGTPYNMSKTDGYLLSAGSKSTWDMLAEHFCDLLA